MEEPSYQFSFQKEYQYEFVSLGEDKNVRKLVTFSETESENVFNLALFDILDSGKCSNNTETRNQDMAKVVATVFKIVVDFLEIEKDYVVVFRGNDPRRHRLYRIAISRELKQLSEKYVILGVTNDSIGHFLPDQSYDLYVITNKL
ncbi:DUF6934 family protein [Dyadobacter sp. Leaf189]|uniref:DUF6934 family protein n=1 Tax=Dyadobacter sp. Leaf189 TaxID=1736295 RepID=UPI0006F3D712|nr:hypothetical protein [Dyadobacter sp. Leaf189]KQS33575.1 hypothetical protein ASG33_05775 [Dyadobacter sp. Leaf189]